MENKVNVSSGKLQSCLLKLDDGTTNYPFIEIKPESIGPGNWGSGNMTRDEAAGCIRVTIDMLVAAYGYLFQTYYTEDLPCQK